MRVAVIGSMAVLIAFQSIAVAADYRIPVDVFAGDVRGPYRTGTFEELWIDETRGEATTIDPSDKRHLMVQIWYPAEFKGEPPRAPYALNRQQYAKDDQASWLDDAKSVRTTSLLRAPLANAPERFPVLIYNLGGGHPQFSATFQTEFLASHGYVVLAVGHTGISRVERFPDGYAYRADISNPWLAYASGEEVLKVAKEVFVTGSEGLGRVAGKVFADLSDMERFRLQRHHFIKSVLPVHVQDIRFALDRMQMLNETQGSRFNRRLDLERVGSLGWSIGGALSILASRDEPRIKAAVNLDGWLYTDVAESGTGRPIMQIHGDSGAFSAEATQSAAARELSLMAAGLSWQLYAKTTADWYDVTLKRAAHARSG